MQLYDYPTVLVKWKLHVILQNKYHTILHVSYRETHPWLVFDLRLAALPAHVWGWIGQAVAISAQIESAPLLPRERDAFMRMLRVQGAQASGAIEDNLNTEQEVRELETGMRKPRGFQDSESINLLELYQAANQDRFLGCGRPSRDWLCTINRRILDGAVKDVKHVVPGVVRTHNVRVGSYRAPDHEDCSELVAAFCSFFGDHKFWHVHAQQHGKQQIGLLKAIVAHIYIAWIHPFGDGNGRAARMVEYMLLSDAGLSPAVGISLTRHCHITRPMYYEALMESVGRRRNYAVAPLGFVTYAVEGLLKQLKECLAEQSKILHELFWQRLLEDRFAMRTKQSKRLMELADCLAKTNGPVKVEQMPGLSYALERAYAKRTYHTLARDLRALVAEGWIRQTAHGHYASCKREILGRGLPQPSSSPAKSA